MESHVFLGQGEELCSQTIVVPAAETPDLHYTFDELLLPQVLVILWQRNVEFSFLQSE